MTYRRVCTCCGSCPDAADECASTVNFTATTPEFDLRAEFSGFYGGGTSSGLSMPTTTTAGTISCANEYAGSNTCKLQYMCDTCYPIFHGSCDDCDYRNYELTTIPAVLKVCTGSDCGNHNKQWNLATSNGSTMCNGTYIGGSKGSVNTYKPALQSFFCIPSVSSINPHIGEDYWEYSLTLSFPFTTGSSVSFIGDVDTVCGNFTDSCGRIGGAGFQQVIGNSTFYNTGQFVVRKYNDSCFGATWNGTTQTASGSNVISITPPTGSTMGIKFGARLTASTGGTALWDECDFVPTGSIGSYTIFGIDTSDSFYTSEGGTCSWSIT
tara:strand:- start:723 stop:1694 length:972 start_codon:yes stop_codon:yes gene_type:complete